MLVAQGLFVASDTVIKLASEALPSTQIMAVRGTIATALMLGVVISRRELRPLPIATNSLVVLRAVSEAFVAMLFLLALPMLALPTITTILQATPLMLTALSAMVLAERVGWRRWLAVAIGFVGVVLVVQPRSHGVNPYALLALGSAALVAVRDLVTRQIDPAIPPTLVTLVTTIVVCLMGYAGAPFQDWQAMSARAIAYLGISAVLVSAGHIFIVNAFRGVEISVVSPFRYVAVVWSLIAGALVWASVPDSLALVGTLIIVASGVYTMHREARRRRDQLANRADRVAGASTLRS